VFPVLLKGDHGAGNGAKQQLSLQGGEAIRTQDAPLH
jgi:hypothetical protein